MLDIVCKYDELKPISELKPNPKNPNKHSEDQIKRLSKIIEFYGWRHPVIVSKQSGLIVVGHGRYCAAKELKTEKIPIVYQDFVNEDEEYAFMVADNGISDWADLDLSMINAELQNLGPDFDIDLLGIKDFVIEPMEKYDLEETKKNQKEKEFILEVTLSCEDEMNKVYTDLCKKGLIVRIK